ncbi:MAG: OsmC family protein [Deltaproteobacteria bacterium]|nr:OsmC family protein [Deltaproteobacteria bacterium]
MATTTDIIVTLGAGKKVDAHLGAHVVHTDQPVEAGGEDSAPSPYSLFLASLAACAGFYVQRFCESRGLPTEGIRVIERTTSDPDTKLLARIDLIVEAPRTFPDKYVSALQRAVDGCSVKRAIQARPDIRCEVQRDMPLPHVA